MIYSIDFDGTIVENKWPEIGELKTEAKVFIKLLKSAGHEWILNTMRENDKLEEALEFLKENDIAPDYVNENHPMLIKKYDNNPRKIYADVYIDDHNAGGLIWPSIRIKNAKEERTEKK